MRWASSAIGARQSCPRSASSRLHSPPTFSPCRPHRPSTRRRPRPCHPRSRCPGRRRCRRPHRRRCLQPCPGRRWPILSIDGSSEARAAPTGLTQTVQRECTHLPLYFMHCISFVHSVTVARVHYVWLNRYAPWPSDGTLPDGGLMVHCTSHAALRTLHSYDSSVGHSVPC